MQCSYIILKTRSLDLIEGSVKRSLKISQKNFFKLLNGFFTEIKDREFIILLADGLVYKKEILVEDPQKTQDEYDKFISQISSSPEKIRSLRVYEKDKLLVLAVNSEIYLEIKEFLEKRGGRVEYVFPKSMVEELLGVDKLEYREFDSMGKKLGVYKKMNYSAVSKLSFRLRRNVKLLSILKESSFRSIHPPATGGRYSASKINFLDSPKIKQLNLKNENPPVIKKGFREVFFVAAAAAIILISGLILNSGGVFKDEGGIKPLSSDNLTIPSPFPSPTFAFSEGSMGKEGINIRVLNGSGIGGQAGRVRDQLLKTGFLKVEIDNAEKKEKGSSVVYFKEGVPADLAKEILDQIKVVLKNVIEEATGSGEVDVLVITKR